MPSWASMPIAWHSLRIWPSAYAWADLVICRAGALTVAELAVAGVASVLVPYPHAVDDHQTGNAQFLAQAGAAILLPQNELTAERLNNDLQCATQPMGANGREGACAGAAAGYVGCGAAMCGSGEMNKNEKGVNHAA
jgi:UDP-N-acetylglucosamine:LPS N-acetylglucosamine transferase